jgi:ABC-2 type transport system ATP-binding protein
MPALIEAEGLVKSFGMLRAVDGISLQVQRGEVLGFLGPNGAGKSTTMKMITGFLEPDVGTARIAGRDVQQNGKEAKSRLGYLPEGAPAYGEMTPRAFLRFIAELRGFRGGDIASRVARAVDRTGLGSVMDQTIETLSKGYKRRVGLAQAILHDPQVLIMDEPTDGLDPNQKHLVRNLIIEMAREKAIIVSTHILEEVEAVCTRAVIINRGRIVADGTAEQLMRRDPYHGSVEIRIAADKAEAAKAALGTVAGVGKIETMSQANGHWQLRVVPASGATIAGGVAAALRDKGLAIDEISVERGKLDDVFRQITTSDRS